MMDAAQVIRHFQLVPLPGEGGYYRQTFKDRLELSGVAHDGIRNASTAIYYLITECDFSRMHVLRFAEVWHYYAGTSPAKMIQINPTGQLTEYFLGADFENGQVPQVLVESGVWQGTRLVADQGWALFGTSMAPGFEFQDCTIGDQERLGALFPGLQDQWERYI
jgi:uncharacterized protein